MTREQFETTFLKYYKELVGYAAKRVPDAGMDVVHQAYANCIEHQTYLNGPYRYARIWVFYKVGREVSRTIQSKRIRANVEQSNEEGIKDGD